MKYYSTILCALSTLIAINASAITIVNANKYTVDYKIADAATCVSLNYSSGQIGKNGSVNWFESSILPKPDHVCVHVTGQTSTTGSFARGVKNEGCVLTVKNAGFMRGIKISKGPNC